MSFEKEWIASFNSAMARAYSPVATYILARQRKPSLSSAIFNIASQSRLARSTWYLFKCALARCSYMDRSASPLTFPEVIARLHASMILSFGMDTPLTPPHMCRSVC